MLAAEVLEPFYEQLAEWEKLIDLYEVMVVHAGSDRADRALHRSPTIYERQLRSSTRASTSTRAH